MLRLILDLLEHVEVSFSAISGSVPILIKPLSHCPCSWPNMSLCLALLWSGAWPSSISLCVKLFYVFPRWIFIRLTWNLSRFVPNSVEILTWRFRKTILRENFSEISRKPRLSTTETCEISPYLLQFLFWVRIVPKKFTHVLSYVVRT